MAYFLLKPLMPQYLLFVITLWFSATNNVFSAASGSWAYFYSNSQLFRYFYNSIIITSNTSVEANNYTIYSIVNNSTASPQVKMLLNNNLVGSSSLGHTSYGSFNIGAYNNNYNLNGNILEIMFYSRTLTDNEHNQIQCYLANKWGVATTGC